MKQANQRVHLYEVKNSKMKIEEFIPLNPKQETVCGISFVARLYDKELEIITYENDPLLFSLNEPRIKAEMNSIFYGADY